MESVSIDNYKDSLSKSNSINLPSDCINRLIVRIVYTLLIVVYIKF